MTTLVRIVLIDPSHPGNIGSVARAMKNMALSDLVLVRPRSFPHAEANALAAGADDILSGARIVATGPQAMRGRGLYSERWAHRGDGRRGDERLRVYRGHDFAAALVLLGIHDAARCRRPN